MAQHPTQGVHGHERRDGLPMARNGKQIGGELIVVLVLVAWSQQAGWALACAFVLLPGLRSLWWPRRRPTVSTRPTSRSPRVGSTST